MDAFGNVWIQDFKSEMCMRRDALDLLHLAVERRGVELSACADDSGNIPSNVPSNVPSNIPSNAPSNIPPCLCARARPPALAAFVHTSHTGEGDAESGDDAAVDLRLGLEHSRTFRLAEYLTSSPSSCDPDVRTCTAAYV